MSSASPHSKTRIVTALSAVFALAAFDQAAIGMMLSTIRDEMSMSFVFSLWLVAGYWTAIASFAAAFGRAVDAFGSRTGLVAGAVVIAAGSFGAATADTGAALVGARTVQGIGAAIALPAAVARLGTPPLSEGFSAAFEPFALTSILFVAVGTPVAAALVEVGAWRAIFWIQLPVLAVIAVALALPSPGELESPAKDSTEPHHVRGAGSWAVGLSAAVLAIIQMPAWGWSSKVVQLSFVVGAALLLRFRFLDTRSQDPLLCLPLLRASSFSRTNAAAFAEQFSLVSVIVFAPLYLQRIAGLRPIESAAVLLPATLMLPVGCFLRSRAGDHPATAKAAAAVHAVALAWLAVATRTHGGALPAAALTLWGLSLPLLTPARRFAALDDITEGRAHAAAAGLSLRWLGGCFGFAFAGAALALTGNFATVYAFATVAALVAAIFALTAQSPGSFPNNVR
jgi:MFS family permease